MHALTGLAIAVALFAAQTTAPVTTKPDPPLPLKPGDFIWHPERATEGPVVVIVSIPEQKAFVYRNGIRIGQSTVSTGRPGHATPTGVFTILQKDINHHSSTYNWQPEKASDGPLSILMSGGDRTVYVYRNGVLIGRSAMTVQNPERPLAAGVFVMLEGESTIPNTFVPGRPMPRWMVVSLPTETASSSSTTSSIASACRWRSPQRSSTC